MQIVIDISDKDYKSITQDYIEYANTTGGRVFKAIKNGTPLPKGHGRLKDFDKIEWYGCDFEGKACEKANGDCSVCNFGNCDAKQVRDLPTIIEADKAESEDKK